MAGGRGGRGGAGGGRGRGPPGTARIAGVDIPYDQDLVIDERPQPTAKFPVNFHSFYPP
jgi:hypothetical protein